MRASVLLSGLAGLGAASLVTLPFTGPWLSSSHTAAYHLIGTVGAVLWPATLDFVIVWVTFTAIFHVARRLRTTGDAVSILLLALLPVSATAIVRSLFDIHSLWPSQWIALGSLAGVLALFRFARRSFAATWRWILLGCQALSVFGVIVLVQLAVAGWRARHLNPPTELRSAQAREDARPAATPPRVVWLVLDELGYAQLFERRYPGLALPNFDALARQSAVFTNAQPSSDRTEVVLPSLMLGTPSDDVEFSARGALTIHNTAKQDWEEFDPEATVFSDADEAGYRTGVAGWYNPYCRMLPGVLDRCAWTSHGEIGGGPEPAQPFARAWLQPFVAAARWARHALLQPGDRSGLAHTAQLHIEDYEELMQASDAMLASGQEDFVFIHLPAPHPEGIYDRTQGRLSTEQRSYVDNLALADEVVGRVRARLQARGEWDDAAMLVMGDHGFRTLWRDFDFWSAEDDRALGPGDFDPRAAYVLKLPGQTTHVEITATYQTFRTRELLRGIARREIATPEQLQHWVASLKMIP